MYFCPNCNNVFDITKSQYDTKKTGGANISQSSKSNAADNRYQHSINKPNEEILINDDQDKFTSEILRQKQISENNTTKSAGNAYFICNNCGFSRPIDKQTLIFSKTSNDISQNYSTSDFKDMLYSDILPRTRRYYCPNTKCESHNKPEKKEASFFRMNNTFKVKYICHACGNSF